MTTDWASAEALRPLWQTLHDRLSSGNPVSSVRVGAWSEPEREAVADLLGLDRVPHPRTILALSQVSTAVTEIDGSDLSAVLERVIGPLGDRRTSRALADTQRHDLWTWARQVPLVQAEPVLLEWVTYLQAGGLVNGSVPATRDLITQALRVLDVLPAEGIPLPILADRVLGDPHALDDGRLATMVLRALSCRPGQENPEPRHLWSQAGVETDELSSSVLVAGLRPLSGIGGSALRVLQAAAEAGEAATLTLQQVRNVRDVTWGADLVHVVENPSVMAAALARFGSQCPPLICVSGWPSAAAVLLLRRLNSAEIDLRYHGDLDGDGLRIAAHLVAKVAATPWRMTLADYERALDRRSGGPSAGRVSEVPWDGELTLRMRATGTAVTEESVIEELLDDLDNARPG